MKKEAGTDPVSIYCLYKKDKDMNSIFVFFISNVSEKLNN